MTDLVYIESHNLIELQELTDPTTSTVITDATVTVTVQDLAGTSISGETWPLSMPHDAGGTYRATLTNALVWAERQKYVAKIVATTTGGLVRTFFLDLEAQKST